MPSWSLKTLAVHLQCLTKYNSMRQSSTVRQRYSLVSTPKLAYGDKYICTLHIKNMQAYGYLLSCTYTNIEVAFLKQQDCLQSISSTSIKSLHDHLLPCDNKKQIQGTGQLPLAPNSMHWMPECIPVACSGQGHVMKP